MKTTVIALLLCLCVALSAMDYTTALELVHRQDAVMEHLLLANSGSRSLYIPAYYNIYPVSYSFYNYFFDLGVTQIEVQEWNGSEWVHAGYFTIEYENGHVIYMEIAYDETPMRFSFTWSGDLITEVYQSVYLQEQWQEFTHELYTYQGANLTYVLRQFKVYETWMDLQQATWTYSGSQVLSGLMEYNQVTNWENEWQIDVIWTRDNISQTLEQWWDEDAWVNDCRDSYTYNGDGNCLTDIYEMYDGSVWYNDYKDTYTYNGTQITNVLCEYWNGSEWYTDSQSILTYNGSELVEELNQDWSGSEWVNDSRWLFSSNAVNGEDIAPALLLSAWPNPFNPNVTVSYELGAPGNVELNVYDVRGRLVRTLHSGAMPAGEHIAAWNGVDNAGAPVASGVYLLRLSTPQGVQCHKMTLLK